ncbi:hypothetical protein INR49_015887 [Caranx melampygus]|nr:hypothetical protein INR49_015887 [Caranx melampygus]
MHVMLLSVCVLVVLLPRPCFTAPTLIPEGTSSPSAEPQVDLKLATEYLQQYYNLQTEPLGRMKRSGLAFISKVKDMQIFFGLNVTGELDSDTLEVMGTPRCGVPDVEEYSHIQGTRWNKNVITYSIGRYTRDLPRSTVDSLVESAFGVWARASSLTFVRSHTGNADIMVEFVTNRESGTLAHAFGPGLGVGGDTHFDDDEHWTAGQTGFNLFVVAAHEFGHALGLKHSRNPASLMYPTYRTSRSANLLSIEDIANINALYSPARGRPNHLPRYSWGFQNRALLLPRLMQSRCAPDLTFDAVSTLGDATFFFKERYLWIKHNAQYDIKEGPISNFMPKIETRIDAAFWVPRRSTAYLIHESMFWTVKGSVVKGKPRALTHFGFPVWVQDVDAAVHIVKTGRTLFFMHDIYWSYNENRRVMDFGYPKYISEDFPGVNTTINAAFHKEGLIYFFVGPQVYKFDLSQKLVRSVSAMMEKITEMQNFFGLTETGHLDPYTLDVMREPRCGVPDVEKFSFYPGKPKWRNHTVTYMIIKHTPDMKREDVEQSFHSALKMWSAAAPLRFIKVNHGKADIVICFAHRTHGDFFPFDGPRGVLAHAFQPGEEMGGDIHLDEDETWTAGRQGPSAIMYPNYRHHSSTQYSLSKDDVLGIQTLYGKPTRKLDPQPAPKRCDLNFSFDAAAVIGNEIVFFKNRHMWMKTAGRYRSRLREGHSTTYLPSISSPVDAAYDIPAKGVAYIFTGHKYWVVQQLKMKSRASSIYEFGFSARIRQVDAAVHVSEYGKTVFFTGQFYYRYDERRRWMDPGFPRPIQTDWPGIPRRVNAASKWHGNVNSETQFMGYLSQYFGDVGLTNASVRSITNFTADLETMQAFFGLEPLWTLSWETQMAEKADYLQASGGSLILITQYTRDLSQSQVDATIAKAFQLYSDVIPLDFKQIYSGTADIMILFKGGYHGDFYPFDGAGGVLAHANSPGRNQGGDTHFDDDETWTLTQRGVNLLLVAAHEFGHALGLDHSRNKRALMYPTYQYVNTNGYRLPDDDRRGVQALYGSRTPVPTAAPRPEPRPEPEPEPEDPTEKPNPRNEQCNRGLVFDAATSMRGDLFFFKNGYYWRKSTTVQGIRFTKVSTKWPGINYVDAAFEVPRSDVVYLFEGRQYWGIRAYAKTKLPGYPKPLTNLGLPTSVNKVDAAVYVPTTGKTLIFVNRQYWSYDASRNQMDYGYPRYISWDFPGIGTKVDAAFENYGYIYFSDGPRQTEYNMPYKMVMRVLLNYGWLDCY